jgi:hypothetical protein
MGTHSCVHCDDRSTPLWISLISAVWCDAVFTSVEASSYSIKKRGGIITIFSGMNAWYSYSGILISYQVLHVTLHTGSKNVDFLSVGNIMLNYTNYTEIHRLLYSAALVPNINAVFKGTS